MNKISVKYSKNINAIAKKYIQQMVCGILMGQILLILETDGTFEGTIKLFNKALKLQKPIYGVVMPNNYSVGYYIGSLSEVKAKLTATYETTKKEQAQYKKDLKIIEQENAAKQLKEAQQKVKQLEKKAAKKQ